MIRIRISLFAFIVFSICSVHASAHHADIHGKWLVNKNISDNNFINKFHSLDEVKAEEMADSIRFTYPMSSTVVKRKNPITIRWIGGNMDDTYYLELYSEGIYIKQIAVLDNVSEFNWEVTKDINGGKEFQFKLVNSRFFGDFTFSESFQIKNRIPRAFWIAPAVVFAGGVYLIIDLISNKDKNSEEQDLPGPIDPY